VAWRIRSGLAEQGEAARFPLVTWDTGKRGQLDACSRCHRIIGGVNLAASYSRTTLLRL
jgi:hypothetical protein